MNEIETKIGYVFNDKELLQQALTHSSFGFEHSVPHNERLEFLGDSVLGFVIAHQLYTRFSKHREGSLSKLKGMLVSTKSLARKAKSLELGQHLRFGKGERKSGGSHKSSILADAVEAVLGAILIDGGIEAVQAAILVIFGEDLSTITVDMKDSIDFKTLLQEKLQALGLGLPDYQVVAEEGPAHRRTFKVSVTVGTSTSSVGEGSSKKVAQQNAAKLFLDDASFWSQFEKDETSEPPSPTTE